VEDCKFGPPFRKGIGGDAVGFESKLGGRIVQSDSEGVGAGREIERSEVVNQGERICRRGNGIERDIFGKNLFAFRVQEVKKNNEVIVFCHERLMTACAKGDAERAVGR
jgi:hypothetical protein